MNDCACDESAKNACEIFRVRISLERQFLNLCSGACDHIHCEFPARETIGKSFLLRHYVYACSLKVCNTARKTTDGFLCKFRHCCYSVVGSWKCPQFVQAQCETYSTLHTSIVKHRKRCAPKSGGRAQTHPAPERTIVPNAKISQ